MRIVSKDLLSKHFVSFWPSLKKFPERYLPFIFTQISENYEHFCYLCPICVNNFILIDRKGYKISCEFTEDHFPPESVGGKSKVLVCKECNNKAGSTYESYLKDKVTSVSFSKKIPNSIMRTSSVLTDVRGWHHGALRITEQNKILYQITNKGKQKLPELTEWESQTNNDGKGWQMKITVKNPPDNQVSKGLLKAAYLYSFSSLGYDFIFSQPAEMIRNVLSDKCTYPIELGRLWFDFQTPIHDGPGIPSGLCFISSPVELQCLVVNLPLTLKENNYSCLVPVLIPGPTEDGIEIISRIDQTFKENQSQRITMVPVNNYLSHKDHDCYVKAWSDLKEMYK